MAEETVTFEKAKELGLLPEEFNKIKEILGRTPNLTELSIYAVMWSEHCSYKNSIYWLKKLPRKGPHMLVEAGEENAGLVDIGDGLACAFKIESHNHPSALEPYQGAATGVGGINRDIFTMGARPIAQLNSLRFGSIDKERTKWLLKGVVKGIGDYGNSFGIPIVGGEVYFEDCYFQNPLVNAFSAGIMKVDELISATSSGVGNPVYIVGSSTGKDGINGAAFASKDITEDSVEDLPAVQVGDPFQEKLLLEATLELAKTDAIVGMQDMGAAGITCSTSEMSASGKHGMIIYLDKVPTRQKNMKPWELLLSESQERMLVVVKKGREEEVNRIFKKWDLNSEQIGEVTSDGWLKYYMDGKLVASVPAESLVLGGGAPIYKRESKQPDYFNEYNNFDINIISSHIDVIEVTKLLLSSPNIASKRWVYEQYDSMVGTVNMSTNNPTDAAIVNIKKSSKALAMSVDCNARYVHANPEEGCAIAVSEAARNIVCSGGLPSAITNCLNFGNPYNPEVYWQFEGVIKGMKKACNKFNTPVTGGNVSFYNQTQIDGEVEPVYPTPTIGMIGIVEDKSYITSLAFQKAGDVICLIGESKNDISQSEYLIKHHGVLNSPVPYFNLDEEFKNQELIKKAIRLGILKSAHDVSDGGLMITLMESSFPNNIGFEISTDKKIREDAFLFGESQSRIVVSVNSEDVNELKTLSEKMGCAFFVLGMTKEKNAIVNENLIGNIESYKLLYDSAIENKLSFNEN